MTTSDDCNGSVQDLIPSPSSPKSKRGYQKHDLTKTIAAVQISTRENYVGQGTGRGTLRVDLVLG